MSMTILNSENIPPVICHLLEVLYGKALSTLRDNLTVDPILFFFHEDKNELNGIGKKVALLPVEPLMQSQEGKRIVRYIMQDALTEKGVDIAIMVSEAWMAKLSASTPKEEVTSMRVSERPDRIEVVLFNVMTKEHQYVGSADIQREPEIDLGPIDIFITEGSEVEGTLVREHDPPPVKH